MSAGIVQLTAAGIQDIYLNGKPDVSYFVGVYRRHSHFALQTIEYGFDTKPIFGGSVKTKIPRTGDLLMGLSLKVTLPPPSGVQGTSSWIYPEVIDPIYITYFSDGANIQTNTPTIATTPSYPSYCTKATLIVTLFEGELGLGFYIGYNPYYTPSTNTPPLIKGDSINGLPYVGATVSSQIVPKVINSRIYYKFEVTFPSQIINPILYPTQITFSSYDVNYFSLQVISASSLSWVTDDLMFPVFNNNHITFRSIYPTTIVYSDIYLSIDTPKNNGVIVIPEPGSTTVSGIISTGNLIFGENSLHAVFYAQSVSLSDGRINTPTQVSISNYATATANTSLIQSSIDINKVFVEFKDIKFKLTNFSIENVGNVVSQNDISVLPIPTALQSVYMYYTLDTVGDIPLVVLKDFDWLQIPYGYQGYTKGDFLPGTPVNLIINREKVASAIAYTSTIGIDDYGLIDLPQGTKIVIVGQVSFVNNATVGNSGYINGQGRIETIFNVSLSIYQPVIPISSPISTIIYPYSDNPPYNAVINFIDFSRSFLVQTKLLFPSRQSCSFWGFDVLTEVLDQIIPPTVNQTVNQFNVNPVSSFTLSQSGWIVGNIVPTAQNGSYVNSVGAALINTVEFLIGGQLIETLTGEYIQNALDLKTSLENKPALTLLYGKDDTSIIFVPRTYVIPLPFYFYRETGLAVPLASLSRQDIELRFSFSYAGTRVPSGNSINIQPYVDIPQDALQVSVVADYAFLTGPELDYFKNKKLDYLITQVQLEQITLPATSIGGRFNTKFTHPVTELQVLIRNNRNIPDYFNYTNNGLQSMALYFNGQSVFTTGVVNDTYLGVMEMYEKHNYVAYAQGATSSNVYVYSFSKDPDNPSNISSYVNMSRIKEQILEINMTPDGTYEKQISVYAINYNILRVQFGLGGLLFNSSQ